MTRDFGIKFFHTCVVIREYEAESAQTVRSTASAMFPNQTHVKGKVVPVLN
jgi:hypothetical protein